MDRAQQEGGTYKGRSDIAVEAQGVGGSKCSRNRAAELASNPGQVEVPAESRADIRNHGLWKRGATANFDIIIVDLDEGSYLCMTLKKSLAKLKKDNKDLYLQACLERRSSFTTMSYSATGIPIVESLATQKRLSAILSFNVKQEYSQLCDFMRERMSLTIVIPNSLIFSVPWYKDSHICHPIL